MRARRTDVGTAAMEAVMFSTFFLIPFCILSWSVMQSGLCMHNAVASVRHGAFRASVAGQPRWEYRSGAPGGLEQAEREVKSDTAYYPAPRHQVLSEEGMNPQAEVDVKAAVYFQGLTRQASADYLARLRMWLRRPKHYDVEKGPSHQMAKQAWEAFNAFLASLNAQAQQGPLVE